MSLVSHMVKGDPWKLASLANSPLSTNLFIAFCSATFSLDVNLVTSFLTRILFPCLFGTANKSYLYHQCINIRMPLLGNKEKVTIEIIVNW